ncbi:MAG: undecaprenyl-diphosphate phosphatase [Coriobacteriia bacterium]|nr:undecaprenyl-diphosphate phosphatase [Coriobacteriia bacterium]MBN2821863.1 undecaprenyl-diphosphate phosphatase [Coriobacteriia bacterium]
MQVLQALVLGIVQGAAEFLPISSSGHLVIVPAVFGWDEPSLGFDVLLHIATLVAVVTYFREDLWLMVRAFFSRGEELASERRLAWLIIVATIPTGIIGLAFNDFFESIFSNVSYVGMFLLVTAVVLALAERLSRKTLHDPAKMGWGHAVAVGVAQGMAIAPGISRAGATMAAGLGSGLDREQAARFSFLLSVPIILLAGAKTGLDVVMHGEPLPGLAVCIVGFLAAAISGYAVIAGLLSWLRRRSLMVFSAYCAVVGTAVLVWQFIV